MAACYNVEACSEPSQTSAMELSTEIVSDLQLWTIFAKSLVLDFRLGSEYSFGVKINKK